MGENAAMRTRSQGAFPVCYPATDDAFLFYCNFFGTNAAEIEKVDVFENFRIIMPEQKAFALIILLLYSLILVNAPK